MTDFAHGILDSIRGDRELIMNPVLMAVVENLENKRSNYQTEEDFLVVMREALAVANGYIKSQRVEDILVKIDEKIGTEAGSNMHTKIARMYYEADVPAAIQAIRESDAYSEPVIKNYVDNALLELSLKKVPYFKYLPGFIGNLSTYRTNETVNEWVTKFETYIEENRKKLMLLETVHYLDGIGNGFYHGITEKIKPFIVAGEYSSSKIMLEMKDFATVQVIKDLMVALQAQETNETKQFNLGVGDGGTKVYNYIGPVLKENGNMIIFTDGCFVNLTSEAVDEKSVARLLGKSGDITVQELTPEYVFENKSDYYQLAKSFEFLGFNVKDRGISTKLRNIKVDFKVNESDNLDLYLNDQHIEDPKKINYHQMFVLENNYVKNCSTTLFNNMDKIYNVEFVKLLVNESKNAAAIIINVNEDYYVYDFVDAKKREIYKTDGFKLQQFVFEKFGYDVRALFGIQIDDVKGKVLNIDARKQEILESISKLEESDKLLEKTMSNEGIKQADIESLRGLREKVEREIVTLKNAYILLEDERSQMLNQPQSQQQEDFKLGDTVDFVGENDNESGRIVAIPPDAKDTSFMVYTTNGRTQKVDRSTMSKSQPTNEAKKEDKNDDKAQDKAQEKAQEKEEKAQEKAQEKEEKAQEKEEKAQEKEEKAQEPQAQEKEEKAQDQPQTQPQAQDQPQAQPQAQTQPQSLETAQQGIMPSAQQSTQPAQPAQSEDKKLASFNKLSGELGELRTAIDTVRPEVREKFDQLASDLDTLVDQAGELENLHKQMGDVKGVSDKVDFVKAEKKFDKIMSDLEKVTGELRTEFGKGAQQVQVSESLIASAYDKYIAVVSNVADKLYSKVTGIVQKLKGELIDLDADIKVLGARAYAAKAKEDIGGQAPAGEVAVAGAEPGAQAAFGQKQETQPAEPGQTQEDHAAEPPQHQTQETQAQQKEEPQAQEPQAQENDDEKKNKGAFTKEMFEGMTDEDFAAEYSEVFGIDEADLMKDMDSERARRIDEMMEVQASILKSNK